MGIIFNNAGMAYGSQVLFHGVNIQFNDSGRYGITGANGTGKSTLLRVIAQKETLSEGSITIPGNPNIGFLEQNYYSEEHEIILDIVLQGNPTLWNALKKRELLIERNDNSGELLHLEETIEKEDGYAAPKKAARILEGLGIKSDAHFQAIAILSGGYRFRVYLARLLFSNPDILIMDEPTNHLDITSINWLISHLAKSYRGMVIIISHNRDFLNKTVNHIVDIDFKTITIFKGNYDQFEKEKTIQMEMKEKEVQSQLKKIEKMNEFVERFRAKASKARQAQSRVKQIDKIVIPEVIPSSRKFPGIHFHIGKKSGSDVLNIRNLEKSYGKNKVLFGITLSVQRGEKIAVIGPNGSGKSTLLKIIMGLEPKDSGSVHWNQNADFSHLDQNILSQVNLELALFSYFHSLFPMEDLKRLRGHLSQFLFYEKDVQKKLKFLSGGELTRLVLAKIAYEKRNVLIMDEPTNHLDLESTISLENAMAEYEGTSIIVSHDARFIERTSNRIVFLPGKGMEMISHPGSFREFQEKYGEYIGTMEEEAAMAKTGGGKNQYQAKKEAEKKIRKLHSLRNQLIREMELQEEKLKAMENTFADAGLYADFDAEKIRSLQQEKDGLEAAISHNLELLEKTEKEISESEIH